MGFLWLFLYFHLSWAYKSSAQEGHVNINGQRGMCRKQQLLGVV